MAPNQKVIKTIKQKADTTHPYGVFNIEASYEAMRCLSASAWKIYCYMNLNQPFFEYALSSKDVMDWTQLSENTYLKSINELIEKGYLVETEQKHHYEFREMTEQQVAPVKSKTSKIEVLKDKTSEFEVLESKTSKIAALKPQNLGDYNPDEDSQNLKIWGYLPQNLGDENLKICGFDTSKIEEQIIQENTNIIQNSSDRLELNANNIPEPLQSYATLKQIFEWYCHVPYKRDRLEFVSSKVNEVYGGELTQKGLEIIIAEYKRRTAAGVTA